MYTRCMDFSHHILSYAYDKTHKPAEYVFS